MNKYEMCFAKNLMELGRIPTMEYDIKTIPANKPSSFNHIIGITSTYKYYTRK